MNSRPRNTRPARRSRSPGTDGDGIARRATCSPIFQRRSSSWRRQAHSSAKRERSSRRISRRTEALSGRQPPGRRPAEVGRVDHYVQFADACRGVGQTTSHFDYAGPLTEAVMLGTIAAPAEARARVGRCGVEDHQQRCRPTTHLQALSQGLGTGVGVVAMAPT